MQRFVAILMAAAVVGACTTIKNSPEPMDEPEFRTGSHIPRKDGVDKLDAAVTVVSKETVENAQRVGPLRNPDPPRSGR